MSSPWSDFAGPGVKIFHPLLLGAFPALRAGNRAFRLYLFCLRQKRIPLLSLARSPMEPFSHYGRGFLPEGAHGFVQIPRMSGNEKPVGFFSRTKSRPFTKTVSPLAAFALCTKTE
jgi:hypothetical protein